MDGAVSFGSLGRRHDFDRRYGAAIGREDEHRPGALVSCELHMHALDLPSRESLLYEKIQAHESKGDGDRFAVIIGTLRGVGVDDVLMNERRIATSERVAAECVIRVLLRAHAIPGTSFILQVALRAVSKAQNSKRRCQSFRLSSRTVVATPARYES